jgi:DNA helicase II / ATP-dependent DNA helicase PcrA
MKFIADLHIHSKYSRATAKNLDFEHLYQTAQIKGISVVGTGDFTYPAWLEEIETKLEETEPGLFSLKKEIAEELDKGIPEKCRSQVRFMLQTEISNIYKKNGRVRKNHNLIYFPDLSSVRRFNAKLDTIGNIRSDGRPILGMDAADLLSLMLDINDQGFFVPAHIWTPWFSLFGSKSGFDSLEECFGSLKKHIFAAETGLSSDPPMNWRVEDLDQLSLISNSDAHSPGYLGRNANVFNTELSFKHIRQALENHDANSYLGTLDMYPHQGKYHYDGHRKCNISLNPAETAELDDICPECGRKVTLGVLNRVQELASRPEGYVPKNRHSFRHIIPLADILSDIFGVGPKTKRVAQAYQKAVESLGPELFILTDKSIADIDKAGVPLLGEAINRMREGNIHIEPGYDGEYGKVGIFSQAEKQSLKGEKTLFSDFSAGVAEPAPKYRKSKKANPKKKSEKKTNPVPRVLHQDVLEGLNPEQQQVVDSEKRAVVIQAGPGTGKTRTLTAKIAHLVSKKGLDPGCVLALTFTNKAAKELNKRIEKYLPASSDPVLSATFHAFCLKLLKEYKEFNAILLDDEQRLALVREAMGKRAGKVARFDHLISLCKQRLLLAEDDLASVLKEEKPPENFKKVYEAYLSLCRQTNMADFEDLILLTLEMFRQDQGLLKDIQNRYQYVFVDEVQDLNFAQYELVRLLSKEGYITAIGDPDQSIYGFRGSDNRYFKQFELDFPDCRKFTLTRNYRSEQSILDASFQVISRSLETDETLRVFSDIENYKKIMVKETNSEEAEAVAIGKMIEALTGGISFFSMDADRVDADHSKDYSFSDFAVLFRTRKQAEVFIRVFEKAGIPYQPADRQFFDQMEGIGDLLHLCRHIAHDEKTIALQKSKSLPVLKNVNTLREAVRDLDNEHKLDFLCRETGLLEVIQAKDQIKQAYERLLGIAREHRDLKSFLNALALNQDADTLEYAVEKVSLLTLHAAKGLEFPVVFVAGCEQGLIPFAKDGETIDDIEEERRLFYVAMTRAMDILCLSYTKKRHVYGKILKRQRSVFIDDIEKKLIKLEKTAVRMPKEKKPTQMELF